MPIWKCLLLLACVSCLLWAGNAAAGGGRSAILLNHRIGPVILGEPQGQVRQALGPGTTAQWDGHRLRFYPKAGIYAAYAGKDVFLVMTRSARYETKTGAGVGSTVNQLRRRVGVTCDYGDCQHGYSPSGGPGTTFLVNRTTRRVTAIFMTFGH